MKSDCKEGPYDMSMARADEVLPSNEQLGYQHCFCQELHANSTTDPKSVDDDSNEYCSNWYKAKISHKFAVPLLGVWMTVSNMLISFLFTQLGITKRSKDSAATYGAVLKSIFVC